MKSDSVTKRVKSRILLIAVLTTAAGIVSLFCYYRNKTVETAETGQSLQTPITMEGENYVTATGTTSSGIHEEVFEPDYVETQLEIEEVYLSGSDQAEEGSPILKITDESLNAALKELNQLATQKSLAYRQQQLTAQEDEVTARQTRDKSVMAGKYAQYTYDSALKDYEDQVSDLESQIADAQELLAEYNQSVQNDYYYGYYQVGELKEAYEKNFAALMQLHTEWNVDGLKDHYSSVLNGSASGASSAAGNTSSGTAPGAGMGAAGVSGDSGLKNENDYTKITVYSSLEEEVQENQKEYEEALASYEEAKKKAESGVTQAAANLELLKTKLEEADIALEKQKVSCQSTYDAALEEASSAEKTYKAELERIEDERKVALNEMEEASENLEEFTARIGDGCLYTQSAGDIRMVAVREGSALTGGQTVIAYSIPDRITVTASVSQSDIARITVGEDAYVAFSGSDGFDGKVTQIDPVSSSSSKSSIYYSVTVELSGDVSSLTENTSGTVTFGVNSEMLTEDINIRKEEGQDERKAAEGDGSKNTATQEQIQN